MALQGVAGLLVLEDGRLGLLALLARQRFAGRLGVWWHGPVERHFSWQVDYDFGPTAKKASNSSSDCTGSPGQRAAGDELCIPV